MSGRSDRTLKLDGRIDFHGLPTIPGKKEMLICFGYRFVPVVGEGHFGEVTRLLPVTEQLVNQMINLHIQPEEAEGLIPIILTAMRRGIEACQV